MRGNSAGGIVLRRRHEHGDGVTARRRQFLARGVYIQYLGLIKERLYGILSALA